MTTYNTAKTIAAIATGTDADTVQIKDRSIPVTQELVDAVMARPQCHYAGRRPKAPTKTPTDMDFASYLLSLYHRRAVVSINDYTRLTPRNEQTGVRHVGDTRFGHITGLVSHQEYFSFGVQLQDASVIGNDGYGEQVGQARSFTLLAPNGNWNATPGKIDWHEHADEAVFNQHHGITRSDIVDFAHRNRVQSVMASPYLAAKCLLVKIEDAISHYRRPSQSSSAGIKRHYDVASEIVPSFTMRLHGFELTGEHQSDICRAEYLDNLYRWRQLVQWLVRLDEYAFYLYGMAGDYTAPWVRGPQWQRTNDGRVRLDLHPDLALSYRFRYVSRQSVAQSVPLVQTSTAPARLAMVR